MDCKIRQLEGKFTCKKMEIKSNKAEKEAKKVKQH
mgnify:CR=1 FL=1|tara:strand:- start:29 stop:133 length:105 start_codon:yes stop_codon:yes gene_type:complete